MVLLLAALFGGSRSSKDRQHRRQCQSGQSRPVRGGFPQQWGDPPLDPQIFGGCVWLGFDPWTGAPVLGLRVRGRAARLSVGANDAWWELWTSGLGLAEAPS